MKDENCMSSITVLVGSPRRSRNTALLAESFAKGRFDLLRVTDYCIMLFAIMTAISNLSKE